MDAVRVVLDDMNDLIKSGDPLGAANIGYSFLKEKQANNSGILAKIASSFILANKLDSAEMVLGVLKENYPYDARPYSYGIDIVAARGDEEAISKSISQLLSVRPEFEVRKILTTTVRRPINEKNFAKAKLINDVVLESFPNDEHFLGLKVIISYEISGSEVIADEIRSMLESDETRGQARLAAGQLARLLLRDSEFSKAREWIDLNIKHYPYDSYGNTMLGKLELLEGNFDAAKEGFEKALEIKSDNKAAQLGLAKHAVLTGDFKQSLEIVQVMLRDCYNPKLMGFLTILASNGIGTTLHKQVMQGDHVPRLSRHMYELDEYPPAPKPAEEIAASLRRNPRGDEVDEKSSASEKQNEGRSNLQARLSDKHAPKPGGGTNSR